MTASSTEPSGGQSKKGPSGGRSKKGPSGGRSKKRDRWKLGIRWAALIGAVGVSLVGFWSLCYVSHRQPVAAPFTRVGGATNVETAVDASRFWLTPPRFVVKTPATAPPQTMLAAAQCAMVHNAPLLFKGTNKEQKRLVQRTTSDWPTPFKFKSPDDLASCLKNGDPTDLIGLSTLAVAPPVVQLPGTWPNITTQQTLAPSVIFAAPLTPRFLPDVAVGMALAAHMATRNHPVSLVVVPRYLEADPELERQLEGQNELVRGGVVLGQPITVPDDTRALLRQLLTSIDRHNVLAQVQAVLESAGPLTAALLALIGAGTAGLAGQKLIRERRTIRERQERIQEWQRIYEKREQPPRHPEPLKGIRQLLLLVWRFIMRVFGGQKATSAGPYWRTALGENREVTVWLRSGTKIAGTVKNWYPSDTGQGNNRAGDHINAVLQLEKATLTRDGVHTEKAECELVLVSVEDIELIAKVSPNHAS